MFSCLSQNDNAINSAIWFLPRYFFSSFQFFLFTHHMCLWYGIRKTKWRLWRGLVKVLTWKTLKRWMLKNPPMLPIYNNSAKMGGPEFPSSAVKDSLPVITIAPCSYCLIRISQNLCWSQLLTEWHNTLCLELCRVCLHHQDVTITKWSACVTGKMIPSQTLRFTKPRFYPQLHTPGSRYPVQKGEACRLRFFYVKVGNRLNYWSTNSPNSS